jgi:hypothetical protein
VDAFAQPSDVTAVSAALSADQNAALVGLLDQASTLLRGWGMERGADVDALVNESDIRAELAKVAVVNAVKRSLSGLEGALETSYATDDYRETIRLHQDQLAAGLYINVADLPGFLPGKKPRKWGTIRLGSAL